MRKFICFILSFVVFCGCIPAIFANDRIFVDVSDSSWYSSSVEYCYKHNLMNGVGGAFFAPEQATNRAMLVTVLYRIDGEPAVGAGVSFADVPAGAYYAAPVVWARAHGVVYGTTDTTFAPGDDITREQMVTIIYRYASYRGVDVTEQANLSGFSDYLQVSKYAVEAMQWAVAVGLITGTSATTLEPHAPTTRAQCAAVIWRFDEWMRTAQKGTVYDVTDYGVVGDGATDDTEAINNVIAAAPEGSTVYFPDGTYLVSASGGIAPGKWVDMNHNPGIWVDSKTDIKLLLSDDATIRLAPTDEKGSHVLLIYNSTGITVRGGHIEGDRDAYTGATDTEWCHGISVKASSDIVISNVEISSCRGDGIGIGTGSKCYCQNVTVDACRIHDCFRNGITVTSCEGLDIKNSNIYNISGKAPQAGIDIEPEYTGAVCADITIEKCNIKGDTLSIAMSGGLTEGSLSSDNIQVLNCVLPKGIHAFKTVTNLLISDCTVGMLALSDSADATVRSTVCNNVLFDGGKGNFVGCSVAPLSTATSALHLSLGGGTAYFKDCVFDAPVTQDADFYTLRCYSGDSWLSFDNCTFHLECLNVGNPFAAKVGFAEFRGCTFTNSYSKWDGLFLNIDGTQLELYDCVFDASAITEYGGNGNTFLISLYAKDLTVQGCTVLTANDNTFAPCQFAFYSRHSRCTGDIQYIDNTLRAWNKIGLMPTNASNLVVAGNIFGAP